MFTNAKEFIDSLASNQHFILNLNTSSLEKNLNDAQRKIALRQLDNQIAAFVASMITITCDRDIFHRGFHDTGQQNQAGAVHARF